MKNSKSVFLRTGIWAFVSIVVTFLVCFLDKKPCGQQNTMVGFSSLNMAVKDAIGYHETLYTVSNVLGVLTIMFGSIFAVIGLYQLIKRKNLFKVDHTILAMGILFILIGIMYAFFDKVAINYRPFGDFEPSFPSSHTLLSCVVSGAVIIESKNLYSRKLPQFCKAMVLISWALLVSVVLLRLLSGVHWITDIIVSLLYSLTLILAFKGTVLKINETKEKKA